MPKKAPDIRPEQLQGFKYFQRIRELLGTLHGVACEHDRAHNRQLHMDSYIAWMLLAMFNPICQGLNALQRASDLPEIQRRLGLRRFSAGSYSEAARVFDPALMEPILEQLAAQLPPTPHDRRLDDLGTALTAVDGTLLRGLPRIVQALWLDEDHRAFKAHVHFEILRQVPVGLAVTDANTSEKATLRERIEAGRFYVLDRGYAQYALMAAILEAGSDFAVRLFDNAAFTVREERELDEAALAAGVVRDAVVELGSSAAPDLHGRPVRLVEIEQPEMTRKSARARREGRSKSDTMLIATNRLDLPAELIGLIYAQRWQIEVFFRFLKHLLGCRQLIHHCANGITLQLQAAILATLLLVLYTGRKPTKATLELMSWYILGLASPADLQRHLKRLKSATA